MNIEVSTEKWTASDYNINHKTLEGFHEGDVITGITGDAVKQAWILFDDDNSGVIDSDELCQVILKLGIKLSQDELEKLIKEIDKDDDGTIDYSEFLRWLKESYSITSDAVKLNF